MDRDKILTVDIDRYLFDGGSNMVQFTHRPQAIPRAMNNRNALIPTEGARKNRISAAGCRRDSRCSWYGLEAQGQAQGAQGGQLQKLASIYFRAIIRHFL